MDVISVLICEQDMNRNDRESIEFGEIAHVNAIHTLCSSLETTRRNQSNSGAMCKKATMNHSCRVLPKNAWYLASINTSVPTGMGRL